MPDIFNQSIPVAISGLSKTEREEDRGSIWRVAIIREGQSKAAPPQDYYWPLETLQQACNKFEGSQVYMNSKGPHVSPEEKTSRDLVGFLQNVSMNGGEMEADFVLTDEGFRKSLLTVYDHGKLENIYQLSIDAAGKSEKRMFGGMQVNYATSIDRVSSVDIVPRAAAGGKFKRLIQSEGATKMKDQIISFFKQFFPNYLEVKKVNVETATEEELLNHYKQAMIDTTNLLTKPKPVNKPAVDHGAIEFAGITEEDVKVMMDENFKQVLTDMKSKIDTLEKQNCSSLLTARLATSGLNETLQKLVREQYEGKIFQQADLDKSIKSTQETFAVFTQALPEYARASMGLADIDKVNLGMLGFFIDNPNVSKPLTPEERKEILKGIPAYRSFKQAYIDHTGDVELTGRKKDVRFTQAITTTEFQYAVADNMNKALQREWNGMIDLDAWKQFSQIVPLNDFKTQHRIQYGGYGNLATVAQGDPYLAMTSPSDVEATYTPTKKGGIETVTLEAIRNDDVGSIQRIPQKMARAGKRTLFDFVFDFIRPGNNPAIYDGVVLYHTASHANLGADTALDATVLNAALVRMLKQTEPTSSKRLGIRGKFLIVPPDLRKTAYELVTPSYGLYNNVPTELQSFGIIVIVNPYWTDTNDYVVAADRADVTGLEVGFLDGKQEPEIFVSDLPNVGSWFSNDVLTYKIRHIYGGAITDWRAFDGTIKS